MVGLIGSLRGSSYKVSNSLRFRSSNSAFLSRTPTTTGNRTTWTWSGWVKRGSDLGATFSGVFGSKVTGNMETIQCYFQSDGTLAFLGSGTAGGIGFKLVTSQVFRDISAWYHIVAVLDTTQTTPSNRVRLYVNGSQISSLSTSTYCNQNDIYSLNNTNPHYNGVIQGTHGVFYYFDGYLADINFIDGQALTPSSFGKINGSTGVWSPKKYTGTYGTNGFYLNFKDNSAATSAAIGKDYSGKYNNWTPNNISLIVGSSYDSMVDSPTLYGDSLQYFTGTRYPYNALNFRSSASTYLSRTPTVAGNRRTWTWSGWVKRGTLGVDQGLIASQSILSRWGYDTTFLRFNTSDNLYFLGTQSIGLPQIEWTSSAVFREALAWYHVVVALDTNQPTNTDGLKIYINGVLQAGTFSAYLQNYSTFINNNQTQYIGRATSSLLTTNFDYYNDGYLADINFIDGQALTPSSFGETVNGVWKPKAYSGTYGTNGFYLKFNDNSAATDTALGKDSAGINNWTPTNLDVTDVTSTDITSVKLVNPNYGLQFRSSASTYLSRTPSVAGNRTTWTWSGWVKRSSITNSFIFGTQSTSVYDEQFYFAPDGRLTLVVWYSMADIRYVSTTESFADMSTWYHVMLSIDTTQTNEQDRVVMYVNGIRKSTTLAGGAIAQNHLFVSLCSTTNTGIGRQIRSDALDKSFDGYLAEVNFIDGQALTPTSFGETIDGTWVPKSYTGTYGTNGFYLNFADRSAMTDTAIGNDASSNSNNWTPNNFVITDAIDYNVKASRGNYATLNQVSPIASGTIADGNLKFTTGQPNDAICVGSFSIFSGKWYWEVTPTLIPHPIAIGILKQPAIVADEIGRSTNGYSYKSNGEKVNNNLSTAYGQSYVANDIVGVALDLDADTLTFYKNNVSQGIAYSGLSGEYVSAIGELIAAGDGGVIHLNFGQRPFVYTPPAGFKALNTYNLSTPTIINPALYMAATTYTGTGAALSVNNITNNKSFQPDLVWIKSRSAATDHALYDSVRGVQKDLVSNSTAAETTQTAGLLAFNDNGFNIGNFPKLNTNAATYVAWQWKAGDSVVTNTTGSITSQVNANSAAGFSVVTYTGTGIDNPTIGHGLNAAPAMIFAKDRDTSTTNNEWWTYHKEAGAGYYMILNTTADRKTISGTTDGGIGTSPSTTTFTIQKGSISSNNLNEVGDRYVAYCFAEVEGYSKFGSYTGNGSADGPFVYCGFRPKWVMIKRTDSTSNWEILDSTRDIYNYVFLDSSANLPAIENATDGTNIDYLSNGFKHRDGVSTGTKNVNGGTYVFAAFAETPFKYSLAR